MVPSFNWKEREKMLQDYTSTENGILQAGHQIKNFFVQYSQISVLLAATTAGLVWKDKEGNTLD